MSTFTSSLPDDLLQSLAQKAKELSVPKNTLIERALRIYLEQLNRAAYVKSYKQMAAIPICKCSLKKEWPII